MVFLSFVFSVGLIVMSDQPLNKMLGEHPLQSELVFIEGQVKTVKSERALMEQDIEPVEKGMSEEETQFLLMMLSFLMISGLLGMGGWQVWYGVQLNRSKEENDPKPNRIGLGVVVGLMLSGCFLMALGVVYSVESHQGLKGISEKVEEVTLRKKQRRLLTPSEKNRDGLIMDVYQRDKDRGTKGLFLISFGVLVLLASGVTSHFSRKH
jgi:hypothetical protein